MKIGSQWNGWKVDSLLGEGSFGKVYRIVREEFGHTYESALKVIDIPQNRSEFDSIKNEGMNDESVTEYFHSLVEDIVDEFALMSKLKGNTNIVSYEDHFVVPLEDRFGWRIYIRMELLTPLYDYMREHTLSIRDVIQLGIDMCKALEVCQRYNIIHRDIKPENIFVSELGKFKLGDFGIARQLEKTLSGLSKKGTYTYMAPEVYKGMMYNSTVDIYSLGIVLYRFLNNNRSPFMPPYPHTIKYSDKEKANILRISGEALPKPCNAEGRLAEIILKACSYNPSERYESALEMRKALQSVLYSEQEGQLIYPNGDKLENKDFSARFSNKDGAKAVELDSADDETVLLMDDNEASDEASEATALMEDILDKSKVGSLSKNKTAHSDHVSGKNVRCENESVRSKNDNKKSEKKVNKNLIIISVIACALIAVLTIVLFGNTHSDEFEYASNIYVNDIPIGGLTEEEAKALLVAKKESFGDDIAITVNADDESTTITEDDFTYIFNIKEVLNEAKEYCENNTEHTGDQRYTITLKVDDSNIDSIIEMVVSDLNREAVNAEVTAFDSSKKGVERFTFADEEIGMEIDESNLEQQLKDFFSSGNVKGEIHAKFDSIEPKYTKEYLATNIKKLSSFSTVSTDTADANTNMKLSLSACNNSIINPDEIWSFNDCTGDFSLTSNGYKSANVIVDGKNTKGVGGGVCQTSTTIYNATMLCGMEVVERRCQYYEPGYVDVGRDVNVEYDGVDLKVKNIFDYQLFMECYMKDKKLYCNIYGIENPEFDEIKITSSVASKTSDTIKTEASRTYYLDGKKVKTEELPSSVYYAPAASEKSSSSKPASGSSTNGGSSNFDTPTPDIPDVPVSPDPPVVDPPVVDPPVVDPPDWEYDDDISVGDGSEAGYEDGEGQRHPW